MQQNIVHLHKDIRICGIGHRTYKRGYPLQLPGECTFEVPEGKLKRYGLAPADFLTKYYKLQLDLGTAKNGQLQPFELKSYKTVRPAETVYDPEIITMTYRLELRSVGERPTSCLKLNLADDEFERIAGLFPATRFEVADYGFKQTKPPVAGSNNDIAFSGILCSKDFESLKGKWVALHDGELLMAERNFQKIRQVLEKYSKAGELYIRRLVHDSRPSHM